MKVNLSTKINAKLTMVLNTNFSFLKVCITLSEILVQARLSQLLKYTRSLC